MLFIRIWQIAGWTMLHYLWIGAALGILALLVRRILRSSRANVRYFATIVCFFLLSSAPLPIAVVVLENLSPWVPPQNRASNENGRLASALPTASPEEKFQPMPAYPAGAVSPASADFSDYSPGTPISTNVTKDSSSSSTSDWLRPWFDPLAACLPWLWVIGAPITFLLTTAGLLGAERLKRQSRLLDDSPISETCRRLAASLKISCRVSVGICDRIAAPILVGILRPMILLPAAAMTGWTPEQLEMVLLHELAHVRRHDNLVNLFQRAVESLLFFHPMIWLLSSWIRREREFCCDELVVAVTRRPHDYAEILVYLADRATEKAQRGKPFPSATAVSSMAEHPLLGRIRRIMKKEDQTMQVSRKAVSLTFAAALAIAVALGWYYAHASYAEDDVTKETEELDEVPQDVVEGVVVDEQGKPLTGIEIKFEDWHGRCNSAKSDAQGAFRLELPQPIVNQETLLASNEDGTLQGIGVADRLRAPSKPLQIVLKPSRTVEVSVADASGNPVAGAAVMMMDWALKKIAATSDSQGKAILKIPADTKGVAIVVLKPGLGMDYSGDNDGVPAEDRLPPEPQMKFVLGGVRPIELEICDETGKPVPGVEVQPGRMLRRGRPFGIAFWGNVEQSSKFSDDKGLVKFDWLPADLEKIDFVLRQGDYIYPNGPDFRISDGGKQHILVKALTPAMIGGKVLDPNGKPRGGMLVHAEGHGTSDMYFRDSVRTAADGSYRFKVYPNNSYLLAVAAPDWAANLTGINVKPGEKREDLDLHLIKGCLIRGTITQGAEKKPFFDPEGQPPTLVQIGPKMPDEWQLPASYRSNLVRWGSVDEKGQYSFRVGPGEYFLRLPSYWSKRRAITVADQKEIVLDDHVSRTEKRLLEGVVVDKSGKPVPGAQIMGFGNGNDRKASDDGRFKAELWPEQGAKDLCLYARSAKENLSGYKVISPDAKDVTIEVEAAPSLSGRVLDEAGKPVVGVPVYCNVFAPISRFHCYLPSKVETDKDGNYFIPALFVGFCGYKGDLTVSRFSTEKNGYEVFLGTAVVIEPGVNKVADIVLSPANLVPPDEAGSCSRVLAEKPQAIEAAEIAGRKLPEIDAVKAGQAAIAKYDFDKDGKLDSEEMPECPALLVAYNDLDTDRDHAVTAEEIAKRINSWQAAGAARISIECSVTYRGKPLEGAEIRLIPEEFLGPTVQVALGKTDSAGRAKIGITDDGMAAAGVAPGFYRVEIVKSGEEIPVRYNQKTMLGVEISLNAEILRDGLLRFDLF